MANWAGNTTDVSGLLEFLSSWGLAGAAVLAAVAVGTFLFVRRRSRRAGWALFQEQSLQMGLSGDEQQLLRALAVLARGKDPRTVFTSQAMFNKGSSALMKSRRTATISQEGRMYILTMLNSVREKLGFIPSGLSTILSSSRQVPEESRVYLVHAGTPNGCEATVLENDAIGLLVAPDFPLEAQLGENYRIRYCQGSSVWEFDSPVIGVRDGRLYLNHSENVRYINRRKFPRIAVDREARIAAFPFLSDRDSGVDLTFVPARLVEIAGPGLQIQSSVELQAGHKALVTFGVDDGRVIEGIGKVRRADPAENGTWLIVLEMMSLDNSEIAVLAKETNTALVDKRRSAEAVRPVPAKRHVREEIPEMASSA